VTTRARDGGPLAREIEHTADLGLEVEAPSLAALFERAGLAVVGLMLDPAVLEPREPARLTFAADGLVELLHDWLHHLVVAVQTGGIAPAEVTVEQVDERALRVTLLGERVDPARHALFTEVKAVTWHQLAVAPRGPGWWARVIVDV
jgi:SHS2 domain-containing protein